MAQLTFFKQPAWSTLAEIAVLTGAQLLDAGRADVRVNRLAALEGAGPTHLTFFDNKKYADQLARRCCRNDIDCFPVIRHLCPDIGVAEFSKPLDNHVLYERVEKPALAVIGKRAPQRFAQRRQRFEQNRGI